MPAGTLLISVGGATGPIVYSIRQNQPEKVIFFVSAGSRRLVSEEILPQFMRDSGRLPDHEFVVTPDEQDLGASMFTLMREVPVALRRLNASDKDWPALVDFTGGTKTMSAATVWASSRYPCRMSYVGAVAADGRTREGLGTVVDGREVCFLQENPWDRIALIEAHSALEIFNRGQYANAAAILRMLRDRVSEGLPHRLFSNLAGVFEGFYRWDIFDHKGGLHLLEKHLALLQDLAQIPQILIPGLKEFSESSHTLLEVLKGIKAGEKSWGLIHDLLANALRRAELEQKYEDATARCYAAIEKTAQHQLLLKYGIDAGNARPEQLPDKLREEYVRRYEVALQEPGQQPTRRMQFGLFPAMDLLQCLGDPVGIRFSERRQKLRAHLAERNKSILAHGIQPIDEKKFDDLFEDALFLLKLERQDLTRFPVFHLP